MSKDNNLLVSLGTHETNYPSSTPTPTINTPSSSPHSRPLSRRTSPFPLSHLKARVSPPPDLRQSSVVYQSHEDRALGEGASDDSDYDFGGEEVEMGDTRPPLHRPTDGRSGVPLLKDERGRSSYDVSSGSARPAFATRRSTFRSRSPDMEGSSAVRKKYTYAAFFLLLSLITFVIQTETANYIQKGLGWNKAFAML